MSNAPLRIATRNSPLALWQARYIANQISIRSPDLSIELVPMTTSGDRFLNSHLADKGGKGLFVKELEDALLQNRADLAVHSMKDVPATYPEGLGIVAIAQRENPYDALVSQHYPSLETLPQHATVGTSSLRRQSQLLAFRPDLNIVTLRGNVQTRLNKLTTAPFDAIILAVAGLIRMDLREQITQTLPEHIMLPACGQGALGIECRLDDHQTQAYITPLNDPDTALCVHTERQVNALLGGNCHVPVAVYCQIRAKQLVLQAKVLSVDGKTVLSALSTGAQQEGLQIAQACFQQLLAQGAQQLLALN